MTFETIRPVLEAVGWALLHFLWQGALVALLLLAFRMLARSALAPMRYAAGCMAMLLMLAVFAVTVFRSYPSTTPPVSAPPSAALAQHATKVAPGPVKAAAHPSPINHLAGLLQWLACLWLLGVAALSFYTAAGWLRLQKLKRRESPPADTALLAMLEALKHRLGISRAVRLYTSAIAQVPSVIGWLRPVILFPVTALTGLNESQLRAILAHELAHIRRHDYLVNLLQTAVETLLFYHPAVWWVGKQIRQADPAGARALL
jgi:beta-lactamase regulating signal transducer with metallopeptidase domain